MRALSLSAVSLALLLVNGCSVYDESLLLPLDGSGGEEGSARSPYGEATGGTSQSAGQSNGGAPVTGGQNTGASGGALIGTSGGAPSGGATNGGAPNGGATSGGATNGGEGPLLIDDFDDGDSYPMLPNAAAWGPITDETATGKITLDFKAGGEVRVVGEGFTEWGADLVLPLTVSFGGATPSFDASAFTGIELRVRRSSATATKELRVSVATTDTVPGGAICAADGCYDSYTAPLTLTDDAQLVRVPFATLKQAGFGQPLVALRLTELREIALRSGAGKSFDFSVDQVSFYR